MRDRSFIEKRHFGTYTKLVSEYHKLLRPMVVRNANQLAAAEHHAQNLEGDLNFVLFLRTTSGRLLFMEASVERIEATLQEVLQRLGALGLPQVMCEERTEFFQQWGRHDIRGAGHLFIKKKRFKAQEHRRLNQDYQEFHPREPQN